ncbi:PREDICTED: hemolin-like isoform X1 [Papilio xuthus]|uniref:Hemolin n=1 Tax=Papilio xuthus TaxID=66420 RepID=A0AAJ6Z3Y9_PAPXU|nr:PREDICTED: hemolin-like isoform X1 [Papilio xuthus]
MSRGTLHGGWSTGRLAYIYSGCTRCISAFPANTVTRYVQKFILNRKMSFVKSFAAFAAFAAMCASLPVEDGPILAEVPAEVLFAVSEPPMHLRLPCSVTGRSQNVLYTWQKDGKPFDWSKHTDVVKTDNEGTIVFLKPKQDDEGHYQCFATSDAGVASTRMITAKRAYINLPKVTVQRHKPIEGSPVKLECAIPDSYPKPTIEWRLQLESDPKVSNEVANSRYTVAPDGALYISSVEKSDSYDNFKYVCLASSPAVTKPIVLAEHYIEGLESNKNHDYTEVVPQYLNQNQTLKVGERTYLFCIFGGNPLAHPDWFKDGEDVNNSPQDRVTRYNKSKGKRLLIRDVWLSDQGKYVCKADNEKSTPKEHSFYVTVVSAPSFDKKPPTYIAAKEGEAVTIPCSVLAVPTASISWTYNGQSLNRNGVNFNKSNENNRTVTDLRIASVKKADGGYYGCHGINENGDVYAETLLRVA